MMSRGFHLSSSRHIYISFSLCTYIPPAVSSRPVVARIINLLHQLPAIRPPGAVALEDIKIMGSA